ncbi:MAG: dihydroxy-acid dehydratase [Bacillota bacterium]
MLRSQKLREINAQGDSLRLGTGWNLQDLAKPQVLVESVFGESHPGSYHLDRLAEAAKIGVYESGGKPAVYTVTDMCDGIAMGHDGMNYSLVSREVIAAMVEIHALSAHFDATVLISSCDKSIPAHLMALARLDMPGLHVPGGSMMPGPGYMSSEKLYECGNQVLKGEMTQEELLYHQNQACPTCGACQFMGTASTMQVMSEALGLSLPGNALMPAVTNKITQTANRAGRQSLELLKRGIRPSHILTREAFENAIMVHAAVSGSTNATLHLPAISREVGITLEPQLFDAIHRKIPVLVSLKTSGKWPTELLWYAGGVPAIMREIKEFLHLDALTVTGKTIGENLADMEANGFFRQATSFLVNYGLKPEDIIHSLDNPYKPGGGMAILTGNLAPQGAVVKHAAVAPEMHCHVGPARPFNSEEEAVAAILDGHVKPGDVVIIRYEGPQGAGMPEMLKTTEAIYTNLDLVATTALVTDGRFSGASRGPCIGHVSPEAAAGGPIALVEEGDLIAINIPERTLAIVGVGGEVKTPAEMAAILAERQARWQPPQGKTAKGVLGLFKKLAASPMQGAYMDMER